jgi:hypothetical protein
VATLGLPGGGVDEVMLLDIVESRAQCVGESVNCDIGERQPTLSTGRAGGAMPGQDDVTAWAKHAVNLVQTRTQVRPHGYRVDGKDRVARLV